MTLQRVIAELNRLEGTGLIATYAIGGAVAAQAYLEPTSTVDVDVFVVFGGSGSQSLAPLGDIWKDLIAHGATAEGQYIVIDDWPVQFLPGGTPLLDEAIQNARPQALDGQMTRIMGPEHLAGIALATGRDKDYARVAEFIKSGALDPNALRAMVERFGLTKGWETFKTRFPSANV